MKARSWSIAVILSALSGCGVQQTQNRVAASGMSSVPQADTPPGTEQNPARISGGVMAGIILHKEVPVFPQIAKDTHVSGAVVLSLLIDREGKVAKAAVISGPEVLRENMLAAVRQWTYKPVLINGQPVFVQTTVTVHLDFGAP